MALHILKSDDGETIERTELSIFEGGQVWGRSLTGSASEQVNASVVHFGPGARAGWHRHTSDQILYVLNGIGKVGDREGEHVISAGDCAVRPCRGGPLARRPRHRLADVAHDDHAGGVGDDGPRLVVVATRPDWLSDELYPFESRFFATSDGQELHYIDEGSGPAVVFVHGNPTWSFEFRHLIAGLRSEFRCIAADHVGFGLSSRSARRDDHHPRAHAERLTQLLEHLGVQDATLFLTDWGGPIGLEFARRHPAAGREARGHEHLVLASLARSPLPVLQLDDAKSAGPVAHQAVQRFREPGHADGYREQSVITPEMMDHYRNAQPEGSRNACAALPGHIIGATSWLRAIWEEREAFADKPALIFWGFKDIAFRRKDLERWKAELSDFTLREFEECGHFLAEEAPERILPELRAFLARA